MQAGKKIYFASDQHFGVDAVQPSIERERLFVAWLEQIRKDAQEIHLVGDLFDFWFEYRHAVPKGFTRLLGKLAEICDEGVSVYLYLGNHDMWMFDYLPKEIGVQVIDGPIVREWGNKRFYIAHGDGLGPGDYGYKFLKRVFRNPLCQWLFARLHPNLGIGIASYFSQKSRLAEKEEEKQYLGEDQEWLLIHSRDLLSQGEHYDFFIYGHRHIALNLQMKDCSSQCIILGDWVTHMSYAIFDGENLRLEYFES